MIKRMIKYNENKALAALRALGKNKDYTVAEQPAAKGMVIFINGVPMIPFVTAHTHQAVKQQTTELKIKTERGYS